MRWCNIKKRHQVMRRAIGYTVIAVILSGWSLYNVLTLPVAKRPSKPESVIGISKMRENPSPMDAQLQVLKAGYLQDAIHNKQLRIGDRLIRLTCGRTTAYWETLFRQCAQMGLTLYWRVAERNPSYRILYLGPISKDESGAAFLMAYGMNRPGLKVYQGVVERIAAATVPGEKTYELILEERWMIAPK